MTTTPVACPGPCNAAWRKAEEAHAATGAEHSIQASWGHPVHCDTCVSKTRERLAQLPALLEDVLREALMGTRVKTTGTIGRISVASWPGQASRLLVDRIVGEMVELGADILKTRGIWHHDRQPGPGTAPHEPRRFRVIAAALDAHLDWAMQHHPAAWEPWGTGNANPGSQINDWHRTCLRFTKQDKQPEVRRLAPCPRCHGPWLIESRDMRLAAIDDRAYIECRDPDCRRILTRSEYDAYVKALNASISAAA